MPVYLLLPLVILVCAVVLYLITVLD